MVNLSLMVRLRRVKRQALRGYNPVMLTIHDVSRGLVGFAIVLALHTVGFAHEVTYQGTVIELKIAKYAQPGGATREVRELSVKTVDPKTKKPIDKVFVITSATKVERAGKPVQVANVTAKKDEKVAVVVDHDKPGDEAIRIRFEAAQ